MQQQLRLFDHVSGVHATAAAGKEGEAKTCAELSALTLRNDFEYGRTPGAGPFIFAAQRALGAEHAEEGNTHQASHTSGSAYTVTTAALYHNKGVGSLPATGQQHGLQPQRRPQRSR